MSAVRFFPISDYTLTLNQLNSLHTTGFVSGFLWMSTALNKNVDTSLQMNLYVSSFGGGMVGMMLTEAAGILLPDKLKNLSYLIPGAISALSLYDLYKTLKNRRKNIEY